jgi:hypothetical protein
LTPPRTRLVQCLTLALCDRAARLPGERHGNSQVPTWSLLAIRLSGPGAPCVLCGCIRLGNALAGLLRYSLLKPNLPAALPASHGWMRRGWFN